MVLLQQACRRGGIEVTYTLIESMTADGRDRSLDYKITGFNVPKGSPDAEMVDELTPTEDEIVFPKTSSSVFISTNIDYVLRNLGTQYLIIAGCLTDQCVDSAVRDACDLGYLVTVPTDACVTLSAERHDWSLRNNRGYCRQISTQDLLEEIARLTGKQ
jgi:ureidoacrylate peracid hydrolase